MSPTKIKRPKGNWGRNATRTVPFSKPLDSTENSSKRVDTMEMIRLLHVPAINRRYADILKESTGDRARPAVEAFARLKMHCFFKLYGGSEPAKLGTEGTQQERTVQAIKQIGEQLSKMMQPETTEKESPSSLYWFELTWFEEGAWRMTNIQPHYPEHGSPYDVLPRDVIEQIAEYPIDKDNVVHLDSVWSERKQRNLKLDFVRLSAKLLVGTVQEELDSWQDEIPRIPDLENKQQHKPEKTAEEPIDQELKEDLELDEQLEPESVVEKVAQTLDFELKKTDDVDRAFRVFRRYRLKHPEKTAEFIRDFLRPKLPELLQGKKDGEET